MKCTNCGGDHARSQCPWPAPRIAALFILVALLTGCKADPSREVVQRGTGMPVESYDMQDGVRCYVYASYGISCVKVTP